MGNAAGVAFDEGGTGDRSADFTGYFGQRAEGQPVNGGGDKNSEQSYADIDDAHSAIKHFSILA
jgi:hypothetical protein